MKVGFIGCGNMGSAMIRGILSAGKCTAAELMASARTPGTRQRITQELGIGCGSNREVAAFSQVLMLAVKPVFYEEVISQVRNAAAPDTLIVSIAPGKTIDALREMWGGVPRKIIRAMPNTPALVGECMAGMCASEEVTDEECAVVRELFECFGRCEMVPERLMDVVTGISGSSPAYMFMILEAMADGAVADGMPRAQAYRFAAQAMLGSAALALETGKHPGELKDMVCSPGGTTIEAVRILEEKGLRSAMMEAVMGCDRKARTM